MTQYRAGLWFEGSADAGYQGGPVLLPLGKELDESIGHDLEIDVVVRGDGVEGRGTFPIRVEPPVAESPSPSGGG